VADDGGKGVAGSCTKYFDLGKEGVILPENSWGLLGPEFLSDSRRNRSLGLAATVRAFNDLAVPGLGGVWYGKQLLFAMLGIAVAEEARKGVKVWNIEVANAIEALSCWRAFIKNKWERDARLRGNNKLKDRNESDFSQFDKVKKPRFYVTNPMRMRTVQALPALGLVTKDSVRFNAFRCSDIGQEFIEAASACKGESVKNYLVGWVRGKKVLKSQRLDDVLSPLEPLSHEAQTLLCGLIDRDKKRANARAWVEQLSKEGTRRQDWGDKPPKPIQPSHWKDMEAGARFFMARDAAIAVLDTLERHMGNKSQSPMYSLITTTPNELLDPLKKLKDAAQDYLSLKYDNDDTRDANKFCEECIQKIDSDVLRSLVKRDVHVLCLESDKVKPGPAFRGDGKTPVNDENDESPASDSEMIPLPKGISSRVLNLYRLNLDLKGKLDQWLKLSAKEQSDE
jgi:hypothetical protein